MKKKDSGKKAKAVVASWFWCNMSLIRSITTGNMRYNGAGLEGNRPPADTGKASFLDEVFCVPGVYQGPWYQHAGKAVGCPRMRRGATGSAPDSRTHIMDKDQDQSQANTHVSHKSVRETIESPRSNQGT